MYSALRPQSTWGESVSVMLVNISPAGYLGKRTVNTLRYGQMFAASSDSKEVPLSQPHGQTQAATARSAVTTRTAECDPAIREEVRSLYRQFCPGKSEREVETILGRFAGREVELLAKAREKYSGSSR
eukprot:NODE_5500_length_576_cov_351.241843.p2 GENE.NODE_5500_length_576_cov_351.241843~~NODE_5500_length_576_cov_351.241843.p2  ORF type:complete len:128 (-),score=19.95 NODE_5500_length_576_cov_351.241843:177-560(-)